MTVSVRGSNVPTLCCRESCVCAFAFRLKVSSEEPFVFAEASVAVLAKRSARGIWKRKENIELKSCKEDQDNGWNEAIAGHPTQISTKWWGNAGKKKGEKLRRK